MATIDKKSSDSTRASEDGVNSVIVDDATDKKATQSNTKAQAYEPNFNIDEEDNAGDAFDFVEEDRFTVSSPVWKDVNFAYFFFVILFIFIILSSKYIFTHLKEYKSQTPVIPNAPTDIHFGIGIFFLFVIVANLSVAISFLIFNFAGNQSARFTGIGFKVAFVLFLLAGVSAVPVGQIMTGFIFISLAGIMGYIYFRQKAKIELSANVLAVVIQVLKKYPSTAVAALIGFFSSLFFQVILNVAVGTAYITYGYQANGRPIVGENGDISSKPSLKLVFALLFLNFSGLYIIDVMKNVMHVTIAGIYGTWYYLESTFTGMPRNEGLGSFRRSMTYNFGSVCYGSLFVVAFQSIAIFFTISRFGELGIIGSLMKDGLTFAGFGVGYFNLYAYSFVALYGASLIKSAGSTWKFFKERGIHAVTNDFIISISMGFYCIAAGICSSIITGIFMYIFSGLFKVSDGLIAPVCFFSFLMSFQITTILVTTVVSGSSAFFLALNKDPSVFEESQPFEFQEISRSYPKVLEKIDFN